MKNKLGLKTKCSSELGRKLVERNSWLGLLVQSVTGHDAGRYYIVVSESLDRIHLVDGRYHRITKPKAKAWQHVVILKEVMSVAEAEQILKSKETTGEIDAALRKLIQQNIC